MVYALAFFHLPFPPLRKGDKVVFVCVNRNFRARRHHDRCLFLLYDGGTFNDIAVSQLVSIIAWGHDKPARFLEINPAFAFQGPRGGFPREALLGQHEGTPPSDHPQFEQCDRRWQGRISPAIESPMPRMKARDQFLERCLSKVGSYLLLREDDIDVTELAKVSHLGAMHY